MRSLALALALFVAVAAALPGPAEARRIGGGGAIGMQRSLPARPPTALPAKPAAPAAQPAAPAPAGATAAAAPRRSWLGPIAGLAAGLGLAALMSHFGFGAELGNIVTLLLLAGVAVFAVRFLMRRFASAPSASGLQFATGAAAGGADGTAAASAGAIANSSANSIPNSSGGFAAPAAIAGAAAALPSDFDAAAFERIAKMIFIRLQAANDAGDLDDLRTFTTPEMFAAVRLDLQDRAGAPQRTDVVRVDAQVLDVASEGARQIVSVRFNGLIRERAEAPAEPFDEVWHLVRPADGSRDWAIAGIQPSPQLAGA